MALTRKHFTILAELVGEVEAGRISPRDIRQAVVGQLLSPEPSFKADKFHKHADHQRDEIGRCKARELEEGDTFEVNGLVLRADEIDRSGRVIFITTRVDREIEVRFYLDPEDTI